MFASLKREVMTMNVTWSELLALLLLIATIVGIFVDIYNNKKR